MDLIECAIPCLLAGVIVITNLSWTQQFQRAVPSSTAQCRDHLPGTQITTVVTLIDDQDLAADSLALLSR
jgi:hypothetical protein